MAEREWLELRSNRMDLVSRWADDLAHEIKNPLHAMVINLELVKRRAGGPNAGAVVQRAAAVESELHRVHALVDSLLRLVRPWPPRPRTDADIVFEELLPVLGARTRVRKVDYEHRPGGGALVDMPAEELALVILNLVDNAIDATPEGGRVATRVEPTREGVRIMVSDTGPGVAAELAGEPPERSATPREGRAGLGLAICHRLVRKAGGWLRLEAGRAGEGTVATVSLPRSGSA